MAASSLFLRARLRRLALLMSWFVVPAPEVSAQPIPATITGLVVDEAGQPIRDVLVFVNEGAVFDSTGAVGAFRLERVSPGTHLLSYRRDGFAARTFRIDVDSSAAEDVGVVVLGPGPPASATLAGVVSDSIGGVPLPDAVVELNGGRLAVTDALGLFEIRSAPVRWGSNSLRVSHRSLTDVSRTADFWIAEPDESITFSIALDVPVVALSTVPVEVAAAPSIPLKLQPFYERMATVNGEFLTREIIENRNPQSLVAALRRVQGIRITRTDNGEEVHFSRATQNAISCPSPLVFLDGAWIGGGSDYFDFDRIGIEEVAGVELYGGIGTIPSQFNRTGSGCGVIVIWTR